MGDYMKKLLISVCFIISALFISGVAYSEISLKAETETQRRNILLRYGWETGELLEKETVLLPEKEDAVYRIYNTIQKKAGFDLSDYYGKTVTRYTYEILNHKNASNQKVRGNLLVCNGYLIAGDIMITSYRGFMHALNEEGV